MKIYVKRRKYFILLNEKKKGQIIFFLFYSSIKLTRKQLRIEREEAEKYFADMKNERSNYIQEVRNA